MIKHIYFIVLFIITFNATGIAAAANKIDNKGKKEILNSLSLRQGQKAPFTGRLIRESIIINMLSDIKFGKKQCDMLVKHTQLLCDKKTEYTKAHCDTTLKYAKDDLKLELKYQKDRYDKIIKIKNKQINSLEQIAVDAPKSLLAKLRDSSFWFGIGIGIVTGIISTGIIVYSTK